jgi:tRNA(fMet)-specific endonuclease VapC
MALLIDTSVLIDLERRRRRLDELPGVDPEERVATSAVVAAELLTGVELADGDARRIERSRFVEAMLAAVPVVPVDLAVARTHAALYAALRRSGQVIGSHDLLIAATAVAHGFDLLTSDEAHFRQVPGLRVAAPRWEQPPAAGG